MKALPRLAALAASAAVLLAGRVARGDDVPAAGPPPAARHDAEGGVAFEPGTPPFATVLSKARDQKKSVFIDFSTEWCGWCKKLDADTFSKPEVAKALSAFVCVHVDAEKGEGPELAKRYAAHGFPTLVVTDDAGEEIDRIGGYMPPDKFVPEVQRIARGEKTLKSLKKAVAADPRDLGAALDLAGKLLDVDPAAAQRTLLAVPADVKPKDDDQAAARGLLLAQAFEESQLRADALAAYECVLATWPGSAGAREALARGGALAMRAGADAAQSFFGKARAAAKTDADRAAVDSQTFGLHMALAGRALERQADAAGDNAGVLNEVAWRVFTLRQDQTFGRLVSKATEWARKAVKLSGEESEVLDTLANLLAAKGEYDEAIALEEKAAAKADPGMRTEFEKNVEQWKAAREAVASRAKPRVVPTPPVPVPAPNPK